MMFATIDPIVQCQHHTWEPRLLLSSTNIIELSTPNINKNSEHPVAFAYSCQNKINRCKLLNIVEESIT